MEQVVELYRSEVERLRAERDAALASERRLWAAVGELREAVGRLEGVAVAAKNEAAEDGRTLALDTYDAAVNDSIDSTLRVRKLVGPEASPA